MIIVSKVPSRKDLIALVYLNWSSNGADIVTFEAKVTAYEISSAFSEIPFLMS